MESIDFVWDEAKEKQNKKKHGVSFEEAKTVFFDEYALQFYDPNHSVDEDRFILLGMSVTLRVVIVCHCFREKEEIIRIISARKADKLEERSYWEKRK
jgi:uncharacterized protein